MNYREVILERFLSQLRQLLIGGEEKTRVDKAAACDEIVAVVPPGNFRSFLREVVEGPLTDMPVEHPPPFPMAFVSWVGARNDIQSFIINNIRELLGLQVQFILSRKIGVRDLNEESNIRNMERTIAELMGDLDVLINHNVVQSITHGGSRVTQIIVESWELDQQYRGGDIEVLTVVWRMEVERPHSPMTPTTPTMPGMPVVPGNID